MADWEAPKAPMQYGQAGGAGMKDRRMIDRDKIPGPGDGLIDPMHFIRFFFRNIFKIGILTLALTTIGVIAFQVMPFPYKAKALVLVDPREKRVTPTEEVLSGIGNDAAVLESVVEIVTSNGFLQPLVDVLDVREDPEFAKAVEQSGPDDNRRILNAFRRNLTVFRLGATYVVEISYTSDDPVKAATYANGVAQAFVDSQRETRSDATDIAADTLSERLVRLRENLQASERAVADFRAGNGIVNVDESSTLQQREIAELSQQIALAKTATESARAQFEQIRLSDTAGFNSLTGEGGGSLLNTLLEQRGLVQQNLAELNLTFGSQHPRIVSERTRIAALDQQITTERARQVDLSKKRLDAAIASQTALEQELARMRARVAVTDQALVQLADLERQAAANRQIYEDFLSRFKSTDEQRGIETQEAEIVSAATPPLFTTRPRMALAGSVIGLVSLVFSTMFVFIWEAMKRPQLRGRQPVLAAAEMPVTEPSGAPEVGHFQRKKVSPVQRPSSLSRRSPAEVPVLEAQTEPQASLPLQKQRPIVAKRRFSRPAPRPLVQRLATPPVRCNVPQQRKTASVPARLSHAEVTLSARLPHVPETVLRGSDEKLDKALAWHLDKSCHILDDLAERRENATVLVSSWTAGEGKTAVSRALATLADTKHLDPALLKTLNNSVLEGSLLSSAPSSRHRFPVIDPAEIDHDGRIRAKTEAAAMAELIEQCRQQHGLTVIDAATVVEEDELYRLASLCDRAVIVFDPSQTESTDAAKAAARLREQSRLPVDIIVNNAAA